MRYYLGYYEKEFTPIKDDGISTEIFDLANFTTQFSDEQELNTYLFNKGLIPRIDINLFYLIEKGRKNARKYSHIKSAKKIYTSESKKFFSLSYLRDELLDNCKDYNFLIFLCSQYFQKYGLISQASKYINHFQNADELYAFMMPFTKLSLSLKTKEKLNKILDYYQTADYFSENIFTDRINAFLQSCKDNLEDSVSIFLYLRKYINHPQIKEINCLIQLLRASFDKCEVGSDFIDSRRLVGELYNTLVYDYDYKNNRYKTSNGRRKIKGRECFDLATIIESYNYQKYLEYISELEKYAETEEESEPDEEYLEESDFERLGTSSEEQGFYLRYNS